MSSAPEQISGTVELVEMILLGLPTRDILLAQRVSTLWKGVILNSKRLQEALFMRALGVPIQPLQPGRHGVHGTFYTTTTGQFVKKYTLFLNPLIDPFLEAARTPSNSTSFMDSLPLHWSNPHASWRRMSLMHPPAKITAYVVKHEAGGTALIPTKTINTGLLTLDTWPWVSLQSGWRGRMHRLGPNSKK